jgi:DnaK suppressor protein
MDKATLSELKKKLEEQKARVLADLESVGSSVGGNEGAGYDAKFPDYGDSMEDNAIEVQDYTKNLSLERDLQKELASIEKTLQKMEDGTYGICNYCGQKIELERLKIRPESSSCVACKKQLKGQE